MTDQTTNSSSTGAGRQTPFDSNTEFDVWDFLVRQILGELEIAKPCKVVAVHPGNGSPPAAGTVDVQLVLNTLDGAGNPIQQTTVYGIPYYRLHGGQWQIVLDPAVGDYGLIVCADRDVSTFKNQIAAGQSPTNVNPGSNRQFSVSDGFYFGGFLNKVPKGSLWLKSDGTLEMTDSQGNVLQTSSAGFVATPASGGIFKVNGNLAATGEITRGYGTGSSVTLGNHTHDQPNDSHGDTEQPTNAPNPGT